MTGTILHLVPRGDAEAGLVHRLQRLAFRDTLNPAAQRVLIDLRLDLERQLRGLVHCAAAHDAATGEWIIHSIWHATHLAAAETTTREAAEAAMARCESGKRWWSRGGSNP